MPECPHCGERHNPNRITCASVQARIDGVTVHNPEGTGGLSCFARPAYRPEPPDHPDEWSPR